MPNYDFTCLSATDFENLCRDILQKEFYPIRIEAFAEGPDSGIDGRFIDNNGRLTILQVKRYENFTGLKSILKRELPKVKLLKPDRYILMTSVRLTPNNKKTIKDIFEPYIISEEDIWGSSDIDNRFRNYSDIERKYSLLWPNSEKILQALINPENRIFNDILKENIERVSKKYVKNESYGQTLKVLENKHYLIISGGPRVGKTTLALILVKHFLEEGYEVISVETCIREAVNQYRQNVKQVFLFDDFLGMYYPDKTSESDGNLRILSKFLLFGFPSSEDKRIILTTREYVLQRVLMGNGILYSNGILSAKYTMDHHSFTMRQKQSILFNRLDEIGILKTTQKAIVDEYEFKKLIQSDKFNPCMPDGFFRTLDANIEAGKLAKALYQYFENPEEIWLGVFNALDERERCSILALATMGGIALKDDWIEATDTLISMSEKSSVNEAMAIVGALKILENSLVKTSLEDVTYVDVISREKRRRHIVRLSDVSFMDFIIQFVRENNTLLRELLKKACFVEQFYFIFGDDKGWRIRRKLNKEDSSLAFSLYKDLCQKEKSCLLYHVGEKYMKYPFPFVESMLNIQQMFPEEFDGGRAMGDMITLNMIAGDCSSISDKVRLCETLDEGLVDVDDLLSCFQYSLCSIQEYIEFIEVCLNESRYNLLDERFFQLMDSEIKMAIDSVEGLNQAFELEMDIDWIENALIEEDRDFDIDFGIFDEYYRLLYEKRHKELSDSE